MSLAPAIPQRVGWPAESDDPRQHPSAHPDLIGSSSPGFSISLTTQPALEIDSNCSIRIASGRWRPRTPSPTPKSRLRSLKPTRYMRQRSQRVLTGNREMRRTILLWIWKALRAVPLNNTPATLTLVGRFQRRGIASRHSLYHGKSPTKSRSRMPQAARTKNSKRILIRIRKKNSVFFDKGFPTQLAIRDKLSVRTVHQLFAATGTELNVNGTWVQFERQYGSLFRQDASTTKRKLW
ncbi:hypothetical protein G3M48_004185 [Beauveria asiatica]|uniref:Uncharacterized protein n=1 Tax=Beauveria asiatica TaxID=1069075 RepID=A0AAW0RTP0_9HYPO